MKLSRTGFGLAIFPAVLGFKSRDLTQLIISQQKELVLACEVAEVSGIAKLARFAMPLSQKAGARSFACRLQASGSQPSNLRLRETIAPVPRQAATDLAYNLRSSLQPIA
ncbi:hypothetical protein LHFGNBLO_000847 [Mesorhizobium sp. AR10]|uniref:hypothetical protein n=1 Tax=Mesorhizobium sp. AR10 TaxID=2865839 RepID=UPI00215F5FA3|nr:hypothetical protein [Mesorhizobium sp. AR10]UVK39470.1 hypothetical protein LHFGNBLO_000847 [Mesorhizobium sp. AR10]